MGGVWNLFAEVSMCRPMECVSHQILALLRLPSQFWGPVGLLGHKHAQQNFLISEVRVLEDLIKVHNNLLG